MAGKYLENYDESKRAGGSEAVADQGLTEVLTPSDTRPLANLADVPVYTEIPCPRCTRIVYWIGKHGNFKCFGCDEAPATCLCMEPSRSRRSVEREKVLRG